jgi:hypothetical protein
MRARSQGAIAKRIAPFRDRTAVTIKTADYASLIRHTGSDEICEVRNGTTCIGNRGAHHMRTLRRCVVGARIIL